MHDALLNRSLRYTILALISGLAGGSVILCYRGLFELIARDYPVAGMRLGWGLAAGVAALLLIRYRGDLIDD
jgi:hypothetical protein